MRVEVERPGPRVIGMNSVIDKPLSHAVAVDNTKHGLDVGGQRVDDRDGVADSYPPIDRPLHTILDRREQRGDDKSCDDKRGIRFLTGREKEEALQKRHDRGVDPGQIAVKAPKTSARLMMKSMS